MRWLLRLWLLGLAALLLASCGSADHDAGLPDDWWFGGQTGSLMPVCGLTPAATERGVPASAPGLVLLPTRCESASVLDAVTVRDASGRPVPYRLESLPNGEVLLVFTSGLTPGDYQLAIPQPGDEDGGVPPAPAPQAVTVEESAPEPVRFGEVARVSGECGGMLELAPDEAVLPYLSLLSVEYQLDEGPVRTLILTGTLDVEADGRARADLPVSELEALSYGEHELRVIVRLAGESVPLETFLLTLNVPCGAYEEDEEEPAGLCSAAPGKQPSGMAAFALLAAALVLRRRKRRRS